MNINRILSEVRVESLHSHIEKLESTSAHDIDHLLSSRLLRCKTSACQLPDSSIVGDVNKVAADVKEAVGLSILPDTQMHHVLYGRSQGREILEKIRSINIQTVIIVSPSYKKKCGIGEYARYLELTYKQLGKKVVCIRTSMQLLSIGNSILKDALILVNHGPGLFDGFNPKLGQGETTTSLLANLNISIKHGSFPVFLLHSLIDTDQGLLFSRQQMILNSCIPAITFVKSASKHFCIPSAELGLSPVKITKKIRAKKKDDRSIRQEKVGFFGFFQYGGKDFDSLIHLASSLRAKLVGSVATTTSEEAEQFKDILSGSGIANDFSTGWVTDQELARRLSDADYFYLPQNDYDHWNNSATARFVMNFDKPVFLPPHHPFLDVADGVVFATKDDLPRVVAHFRDPANYEKAVKNVREFRDRADMRKTAISLLGSAYESFVDVSATLLAGSNEKSIQKFLSLTSDEQVQYLKTLNVDIALLEEESISSLLSSGAFESIYQVVKPMQFWRKHYELRDLIQSSTFESINTIYRSICKQEITFTQILKICQQLKKYSNLQASDIVRYAFLDSLSENSDKHLFNRPEFLITHEGKVITANDISSKCLDKAILRAGRTVKKIKKMGASEIVYKPKINNLIELLTLPPDEIARRDLDVNIDVEGLEITALFDRAFAAPSLYQRFNHITSSFNEFGVDISEHLLIDHPVVREVELNRLNYIIEDFIFFQGDDFIINAIRALCKRDPFSIEMFAMQKMLEELGKIDVLTFLSNQSSCKAELVIGDIGPLKQNLFEYSKFVDTMRDPLAGGIAARNDYLILSRHNLRWKLKCASVVHEYYQAANQDIHALLSAYYYLMSDDIDYPRFDKNNGELGSIAHWMTVDGYFNNPCNVKKTIQPIFVGEQIHISNITEDMNKSLIGFHQVESEGAWTNTGNARVVLRVSSILKNQVANGEFPRLVSDAEGLKQGKKYRGDRFLVSLKIRLYGCDYLHSRSISIGVRSDVSGDLVDQVNINQNNDDLVTVELSFSGSFLREYLILELAVSEMTNPAVLQGSLDTRDLGIMLQSVALLSEAIVDAIDTTDEPVEEGVSNRKHSICAD